MLVHYFKTSDVLYNYNIEPINESMTILINPVLTFVFYVFN